MKQKSTINNITFVAKCVCHRVCMCMCVRFVCKCVWCVYVNNISQKLQTGFLDLNFFEILADIGQKNNIVTMHS